MKEILKNKKAYFDYEVIEEKEVGIVLLGSEVKSIRNKRINFANSFCRIIKNEMFLIDFHISNFEKINTFQKIEEKRIRKVLMKKREIIKWFNIVSKEGFTIVPLQIYINEKNKIKLKIAICRGKKLYDKREDIKEKEMKRKLNTNNDF